MKQSNRLWRLALAPALAGVLAVSACAAPETDETAAPTPVETTPVTLTLNFAAGGQHTAFVMAQELGFYAENGLEVTIQEGQGSQSTAQVVASGQSEFGFADASSSMNVRAQGGSSIVISPIQQTNAFAVISLADSGIEEVTDLRGKTIAVEQGTALSSLLPALLAANDMTEADIQIQQVAAASLLGVLLQGSVDAILGGAGAQAVQLRQQGADIDVLLFRDAGLPTVGLSVITSEEMIDESPELVAGFVDATLRGLAASIADPQAAAEAVTREFPALDVEQVLGQFEVNEPLFCTAGSETLGNSPQEVWDTTYDVLVEFLGLPPELPLSDYYTTEFIPADAPSC